MITYVLPLASFVRPPVSSAPPLPAGVLLFLGDVLPPPGDALRLRIGTLLPLVDALPPAGELLLRVRQPGALQAKYRQYPICSSPAGLLASRVVRVSSVMASMDNVPAVCECDCRYTCNHGGT